MCLLILLLLILGRGDARNAPVPAPHHAPAPAPALSIIEQVQLLPKVEMLQSLHLQTLVENCTTCVKNVPIKDTGNCEKPLLAYAVCATIDGVEQGTCCPSGWSCDPTHLQCLPTKPTVIPPAPAPAPKICKNQLAEYAQCGDDNGIYVNSCCPSDWNCSEQNNYYWQCVASRQIHPPPPPRETIEECTNQLQEYTQCGDDNGVYASSCCPAGWNCVSLNPYYWQCLLSEGMSSPPSPNSSPPTPPPTPPALPTPTTCGNGVCDAGESCSTCPQDCTTTSGSACPRVGILYSGWHLSAYTGSTAAGLVTVEQVLRSRQESGDGVTSAALELSNAMQDNIMNFIWQVEPQGGIYCIYHGRQLGDLHYNVQNENCLINVCNIPDCPDYTATLKRQAQQMVSAGIDFIAYDATNIPQYNTAGDALQLRPFEIILEEWSALRASGIQTPDVAMWQALPTVPFTSTEPRTMLYPYVLDMYNVPEYDRMIMRDSSTQQKIMFYLNSSPDPAYLTDVASNSGISTIMPIVMSAYSDSIWSILSLCEGLQYLSDNSCDQKYTVNAQGDNGGIQIAVATSYQITFASLPFRSIGFFRGITLAQQFETVFGADAQFVMIASWNEFITNPIANGAIDPGQSMGLENDATANNVAFVDQYGEEFSRDIEPTTNYGSAALDMLTSCLRVFRSGLTSCSDMSEPCCSTGDFSDSFAYNFNSDPVYGYYTQQFGDSATYIPLYDCVGSTEMSTDGTCASGTPSLLGYMATTKGGEMLRALHLCNDNTISLVGSCSSGTQQILGYVR